MGGGDISSAKAIAKRIKAKGLGRLRWYCQMCEKQCRDENGFKCHTNTPAHQRQLVLFAQSPEMFVERFSNAFMDGFLDILRQRYGSNPVAANALYQDYIKDRQHIHMNSTQWVTLTEFVKDLGRRGICRVEDRDGSWWLTYIDRATLERREKAAELERARLEEEEYRERLILRKMQDADGAHDSPPHNSAPPVEADADTTPFSVHLKPKSSRRVALSSTNMAAIDHNNAFHSLPSSKKTLQSGNTRRRPRSALGSKSSVLDEIMKEDIHAKEKSHNTVTGTTPRHTNCRRSEFGAQYSSERSHSEHEREWMRDGADNLAVRGNAEDAAPSASEPWLLKGIVVKAVSDSLRGGPYHGKKGVVMSLKDQYTGVIKLNDGDALLESDQDDLQTVIPKSGGSVVFVRGLYREKHAVVINIDEPRYCLSVRLSGSDKVVDDVEYEDVCKLSQTVSEKGK